MNEVELRQKAQNLVGAAQDIIVKDQATMEAANDFVIQVRSNKKGVVGFFKEMKTTAHTAWRTICDKEKSITNVLETADAIASKKVIGYRAEQRQKAEAEARKAEKERLEREQKERDKLMRQAEKAEEKGNAEKAELLAEQATQVQAAPIVVEPSVKKTEVSSKGTVSGVKNWDVFMDDPKAIIKAVSEGKLPESILEIKDTKIKMWARAMNIENYNENGLRVIRTERLSAKANFNRG